MFEPYEACSTKRQPGYGRPPALAIRSPWSTAPRCAASAVWAVERATSVVTAAYRAGGGTSLYSDCPLQRRLRDIHALTQHFIVRRDTLVTAGAILAGQDVQPMVF